MTLVIRNGKVASHCPECLGEVLQIIRSEGERDGAVDKILGRPDPTALVGEFADAYRRGYADAFNRGQFKIEDVCARCKIEPLGSDPKWALCDKCRSVVSVAATESED